MGYGVMSYGLRVGVPAIALRLSDFLLISEKPVFAENEFENYYLELQHGLSKKG